MLSQKGETYLVADSRNRLTPRYGFFDMRLRGNPVALHGRRQGTIPCSSKLTIFSVTIAYTSIRPSPFLHPLPKGQAVWFVKTPNLSFALGLFTPSERRGRKEARYGAQRS